MSCSCDFPEADDYPEKELPNFIYWTSNEVALWIAYIGFPQYMDCFETNFITGRKLVLLEAKHLPRMGIENFEDIKGAYDVHFHPAGVAEKHL
ncbi:sterile alpha motif domain-containing protein 15 [Caerostris extrusa]|uniref:Sterile alpha motif domain-containing protein 15 n=1 Tax=Caerostris extrusa TaxID=172846 RepID=A0AAV4P137_CAEEX|nr:sterile alpha motif domain-containing protein 15 [Caerostris extrusa]